MGRIGIVYQDVAQAARYCQGVNQTPTVDNIRQYLKTGSKSTIARHLREWKEQNGIEKTNDDEMPEELWQLVRGLWERLRSRADEHIDLNYQETQMAIQSLQEQLAQSQRDKNELITRIHHLEEAHQHDIQIQQQLQAQLTNKRKKNYLLTERLAAYERRCQEQEIECKRLHDLLKHVIILKTQENKIKWLENNLSKSKDIIDE